MGSKKALQEKLQEIRHKNHDNIRYRKRKQTEEEDEEYLKEEIEQLKRLGRLEDYDAPLE